MLFNSLPFIFLFLPITLLLFYSLARFDHRAAAGFLAIASLCFYGWWDSRYVLLLAGSICGNFLLSEAIARTANKKLMRLLLVAAIAGDLAILGYYKYAGFFVVNLDALTGMQWVFAGVILPLGISFFTFTQIAFLIDTYRGITLERHFLHYLLFITYFPHLIAGPILHHKEIMPQFAQARTYAFAAERIAVGLSLFIIGLAKKTICADGIAPVAQVVFAAAATGHSPDMLHSWCGALAYSMQIYFDFSAYTDMALGISFMFGIRLPLNFDSPYKSKNIIEFWRRWHMTLSRFLRDYLYIPLGGSRCSPPRRYTNLLATMVLGGLWHGAAWTYVMWGTLHGIYLMINHGWNHIMKGVDLGSAGSLRKIMATLITFLAVVVAWVFFRSNNFNDAVIMLKSMFGIAHQQTYSPYVSNLQIFGLLLLMAACWFLPNAYQVLQRYNPALQNPSQTKTWITWQPNAWWAVLLGVTCALALSQIFSGAPSEFIYFQF